MLAHPFERRTGGYQIFGGDRAGRWGDYSAAVVDVDGTVWFANEYIPDAPRASLANWGTTSVESSGCAYSG